MILLFTCRHQDYTNAKLHQASYQVIAARYRESGEHNDEFNILPIY